MRNDAQRPHGSVPSSGRGGSGNGFFSRRTISSYLRIVSSGASSVASTVRSASVSVASSIANRDDDSGFDQVHWAGFDKLECEGNVLRQVLLLGYRSGFQVWDVEEADDVRQLVSRHDGTVSFLQMQKKPIASKRCEDQFADVRPLLIVAVDGSFSVSGDDTNCLVSPRKGSVGKNQEPGYDNSLPTSVCFYSLRTHDYVHALKFRSPIYSIRCSPRVVAISQAAQIHCFDAATLEKKYTILTCPIVPGLPASHGFGGIGCGPLALGSRWLAYSGSPVAVSSTGRVSPQDLTPSTGLLSTSNGSLVAQYAKESSKQLAAGIVTLGDMGYKKLSKYCSELIPDNNSSMNHGNSSLKTSGSINCHCPDIENVGMVIVRDIVSKLVVVQFRAHKSPISALAFDPSGTLLVTASVHGHNINVFRIMPTCRGSGTCFHLYRLQRGITNAIIQDISFSNDSQWIMISSSRGTSHLFSLSPPEGAGGLQLTRSAVRWPYNSDVSKLNQKSLLPYGSPITLSVVSRIKYGSNGWKGAVSGAAAAATGRVTPLSGAIASAFHNIYLDDSTLRTKYYLLVFSPSGSIIQYVLHHATGEDSAINLSGLSTVSHGSSHGADSRFVVEALQKWDVCHKRNRRDRGDNDDVYGEHGNGESSKLFQKGIKKGTSIHPTNTGADTKAKLNAEENHHIYISEVELQMHSARVPLWVKSKIHFQVMVDENISKGDNSALCGEIEIERIPTRTVEARTKDLIPVFDYLQTPRFEQARPSALDTNRNGPLVRQKSGLSEDGRHSWRSSCSSLDCVPESAAAVAEPPNAFNENFWSDFRPSAGANEGIVNNDQLECVNNWEGLKLKPLLENVNNKEPEDGTPTLRVDMIG